MGLSRRSFPKVLGFCFVSLALAVAGFSLMIPIPLKQLVNESEAIVLGRVQSVQCEWGLDKRLILSIVKVQVQETIKGDLMGPHIVLEVPGGTVGNLSLKVSDIPAFHEKEDILIFLRSIKDSVDIRHSSFVALNSYPSFELYGKAQGKFVIDAEGFVSRNGYETLTADEDSKDRLSLINLKNQIGSILREDREKKQRKR